MKREFNDTGVCVIDKHYMVDISDKLDEIMKLIEKGKYFTINRPRQYGKTTTINELEHRLKSEGYLVISLSFEGIGDEVFKDEKKFISFFINDIKGGLKFENEKELVHFIDEYSDVTDFSGLSHFITDFTVAANKRKIVAIIDEVDKSSNNQLFLSFIGMLRNKFLQRNRGKDYSFHSVILAGVHDVKNLKLKLRPNEEHKFNSPWNIAVDFKVDLSFNPREISTLLNDYNSSTGLIPAGLIKPISEKLYYYTSGYPYLVSKLCKIIDEEIIDKRENKNWLVGDIEKAVQIILTQQNTNFASLITNLENDKQLYSLVFDIIIKGSIMTFNPDNPIIEKGLIYGIFSAGCSRLKIHNRIYEQRIYNYMSSKLESASMNDYNYISNFLNPDNTLDFEKILLKFQEFMKAQYSKKDKDFLEKDGRLVFLAFLKPIINGKGYDFKEVQISEEKRLDVVVTYADKKYVVELKKWYNPAYHQKGIKQLEDYLERQNLQKGYLLIFDFDAEKKNWKHERISSGGKDIFAVWV